MDGLMDVLDDETMILNHPEYKFKNSYEGSSLFSKPTSPAASTPSPSRPNTGQSRASSKSRRTPTVTPREFLETFEVDLPEPDEALNPDGSIDYKKYVGFGTREQGEPLTREEANKSSTLTTT